MAFVPITIYKKSALATFFSILGAACIMMGFGIMFQEVVGGIVCLVLAVCFMVLAPIINKNKIFKLWVKDLTQKGFVQMMPTSNDICYQIYSSNPEKRTIKFIEQYNPAVAADLRSRTAKK